MVHQGRIRCRGIERRKEKLAGGIVLGISSLREGPIPDRIAVNASMWACVVLADVSCFETGALWAVTLLRRAHRSARHRGKPSRIDAPRLLHGTSNKFLLRTNGERHAKRLCARRQITDHRLLQFVGRILPGEAKPFCRSVHVLTGLLVDLGNRNRCLIGAPLQRASQFLEILEVE
jgi:hypothetical protein